jgi:tRNA1Val (adenine37-N6)-methyltransferase
MLPKVLSIFISMNNTPTPFGKKLFHFKKFSLTDSGCSMKIGTDGVLLGSVAANFPSEYVLDIGTGCGLIALMVAQKSAAKIIAIDADECAVAVAKENVKNSPWANQVELIHTRFQDFCTSSARLFDLIVCNPPFFHNSLLSPGQKRNLARHSDSLLPNDLFSGVKKFLEDRGRFLMIAPAIQEEDLVNIAEKTELFCIEKTYVVPVKGQKPKRIMLAFSNYWAEIKVDKINIETGERHQFSEEYKALTGDYYLNF